MAEMTDKCYKRLMNNLDSEEHVSIHQYGNEEITDVIDHNRPTPGSVAPARVFSPSVH